MNFEILMGIIVGICVALWIGIGIKQDNREDYLKKNCVLAFEFSDGKKAYKCEATNK